MTRGELAQISIWKRVLFVDLNIPMTRIKRIENEKRVKQEMMNKLSMFKRTTIQFLLNYTKETFGNGNRNYNRNENGNYNGMIMYISLGHVLKEWPYSPHWNNYKEMNKKEEEEMNDSKKRNEIDASAMMIERNDRILAYSIPLFNSHLDSKSCIEYKENNLEEFGLISIDGNGGNNDIMDKFLYSCQILIRSTVHYEHEMLVNDEERLKLMELKQEQKQEKMTELNGNGPFKQKVAILIPVTSKGIKNKEFKELALIKIFIPLFAKSVSWEERGKYKISIYIGYDEGDELFDNSKIFAQISKMVNEHLSLKWKNQEKRRLEEGKDELGIEVKYFCIAASDRVTFVWNVLFYHAVLDGNYYFYQVNDDLHMTSRGWLSLFIDALEEMDGIGVVGPWDPTFPLLTQSFVTRKHWEIFKYYFPPDIKNWHCDSWISLVYMIEREGHDGSSGNNKNIINQNKEENEKLKSNIDNDPTQNTRMKRLKGIRIWNGRLGPNGRSPRYTPCKDYDYKPLVIKGRKLLSQWMIKNRDRGENI